MEEIEVVLKTFKLGKSLGLDGLMVEVVCECWSSVCEECLVVVLDFCRDGILTSRAAKGVIRFIPKGGWFTS